MIKVTAYSNERALCQTINKLEELEEIGKAWPTFWIQVNELENTETIELVTKAFNIHKLALEDVLTKHQRAKIEQYGEVLFIVAHELSNSGPINNKQLCLFLGKNYVATFQFEELQCLKQVSEKIGNNAGNIRSQGADYLASTILDAATDTYFPILEHLGEKLEDLEDAILENPTRMVIARIHRAKRGLLVARRSIWPLREVLNTMLRDNSQSLNPETKLHLRDCYDHAVELIDLTETYRELCADLMDVYLSSISNRMNEVMKVLTIMASIFAPPALIAAIYGMNFNPEASPFNMPELNWYFGYPFALTLMVVTSLSVVLFLWWKGWLGAMGRRTNGFK